MLTDEQIEEALVATGHWSLVSTTPFAYAIESAATAPLLDRIKYLMSDRDLEKKMRKDADERIAELETEVERFRTDALNEKAARRELEQLAASCADGLVQASQTMMKASKIIAELEAKLAQRVPDGRITDCARRLVEHADFALGGCLSAESKARDIPSNAVSQVKARHLAALLDALAAAPAAPKQQEEPDHSEQHLGMVAQAPNAQQTELKTPESWGIKTAQQAEAQEPCAYLYHDASIPKDAHPWLHSTMLVLAADRRPGLRGETPLFTRPQPAQQYDQQALELCESCGWKAVVPTEGCLNCNRHQPAQLQALSEEEVKVAANKSVARGNLAWLGFEKDADGRYTVPALSPSDLKFSEAVQAALAAKNGVDLK